MKLVDLPNIGPVLAGNLQKIDVENPEALRSLGAENAWLTIRRQVDPTACLHQLQALAGAAAGVPKKELSPERKAQLKLFFDSHQ